MCITYFALMELQQLVHQTSTENKTLSLERQAPEACRTLLHLSWNNINKIKDTLLKFAHFDFYTGCIMWSRGCHENGYGKIYIDKKLYSVHRVSASLYLDFDIESNLCVCHKCDNPRCFRPSHLFIGTQKANMEDKSYKTKLKKIQASTITN